MQIGPIPAIHALPAVKVQPAEPQLSALFDIEGTAQAGDDSYSRGARKGAETEEDEKEELAGEESTASPDPSQDTPVSSISYFA
jgi:hypothetical protein